MQRERSAKIIANLAKIPNKKQGIFYNPVMQLNRDMTILFILAHNKKMRAALPLAGSGVRGIRMLKECNNLIEHITFNDLSTPTVKTILKNLSLNTIQKAKASVKNQDANQFLQESKGFDYIDIDPFGTPNPFLDSAIRRLSRNGILAVTATDTANLAGTNHKKCQRTYWATPLRNEHKHELGLRILIRKVQLIGMQYDRALTPLISYAKDHYMRIFFQCKKSSEAANAQLKDHDYFNYNPKTLEFYTSLTPSPTHIAAGPLYTGKLFDKSLLKKMAKRNPFPNIQKWLNLLANEQHMVGFYSLPKIAKKIKLSQLPTLEKITKATKTTPTHFSDMCFKGKISQKEFIKIIKTLK